MAYGFFRGQVSHRQRTLLDLPREILDSSGAVLKSAFEHYTRTLLEWARDITQQVEGRSVIRQGWWDTNSIAYTADTLTDMFEFDIEVNRGWFYGVHVNTPVSFVKTGGRVILQVIVDGKIAGRIGDVDGDVGSYDVDGWAWFVAKTAKLGHVGVTLDVISNPAVASNIILNASSDTHRKLTIIGFGPAPASFTS